MINFSDSLYILLLPIPQRKETNKNMVNHQNAQSLSSVLVCDPIDCSPLGSSVHGILQARILEEVAISFSRGYC